MESPLRNLLSSFNEKSERYISLMKNSKNCTEMGCAIDEATNIFRFLSNLINERNTVDRNIDLSLDIQECLQYVISLQGGGDEVKGGFSLSKSSLEIITNFEEARSGVNSLVNGFNEIFKASDSFISGVKGIFGSFSKL